MKSIRALVVLFACMIGSGTSEAQPMITYVNTVVQGMTTANLSAYNEVYARGYWNVADGEGGWFTQNGTGCGLNRGGATYSGTVVSGLYNTNGFAVGMGVSGQYIPAGTTIAALTPTTIILSQAASMAGTGIEISGGNGGTLIGDYAVYGGYSGTCFSRVQPNYNLSQWGARCDVIVPNATLTYTGYPSTTLTASVPVALASNSTATPPIVIPGLGGGPYYPMGPVVNGSTFNSINGNTGSNYTPGDTVTFAAGSSSMEIEVDSVDGTGAILTWHFLSYGSWTGTLPGTIMGTGGTGSGAIIVPAWTGSTYVGTITSITGGGTMINVSPAPTLPLASGTTIQRIVNAGWYYGDDDSANINNAIASLSASGATQLNLPGNCGTTAQINAGTAALNNPALVGLGLSSTGLYALGPINPTIGNGSNVFNNPSGGGANENNAGGGLADMTIEAGGLTSGPAVEIDAGTNQLFSNLDVRDALAGGGGNAVFRCGSPTDGTANAGGNWYENILAKTDQTLYSGAQFPDADIEMAMGCHDSFFAKPIAVNAGVANIKHVQGGAVHIENPHSFNTLYPDVQGSADYGIATAEHDYILGPQIDDARFADAFLAPQATQASHGQRLVETWLDCAQGPGAGVPPAFTINTTGTLSSSTTITSVANVAGAQPGMIVSGPGIPLGDTIAPGGISGSTITLVTAASITQSMAPITIAGGFRGIEISEEDAGATITATSAEPECNIDPSAVIQQDGTADPTTSVFGNGSASYTTETRLALMNAFQGRLSLQQTSAVMTSDVPSATTVYIVAFTGNNVAVIGGSGNWQPGSFTATGSSNTLYLDSSTQLAGNLYDVFEGMNGTTLTACTGPAWSNSTAGSGSRGTGAGTTQLIRHSQAGIWVNANAMTCSYDSPAASFTCPAQSCTYIGTLYATANGETSAQVGNDALFGGGNNIVGICNAYNQVPVFPVSIDTNLTWTGLASGSWENADPDIAGGVRNRITYIDCLGQISSDAQEMQAVMAVSANAPEIGLVQNSTTAPVAVPSRSTSASLVSLTNDLAQPPSLGLNYFQAREEQAAPGAATYDGNLMIRTNIQY